MGGFDGATWQALGLALTLVGLGLSAVVWARRGPARGLRGVAWSLLPLAAGLTGVLRLGWEITDAVTSWAAGLVFSPVVWLGIAVAAVSVVLFVVSGWMLRRGAPDGAPPAKAKGSAQVRAGAATALPRTGRPQAATTRDGGHGTGSAGDDMADVEEILRKHGIQ